MYYLPLRIEEEKRIAKSLDQEEDGLLNDPWDGYPGLGELKFAGQRRKIHSSRFYKSDTWCQELILP